MLPELRGGETIISPQGNKYIVHKVRKPKRDTGFEENLYRLERTIVCSGEYTLDELNAMGYKEEKTQ